MSRKSPLNLDDSTMANQMKPDAHFADGNRKQTPSMAQNPPRPDKQESNLQQELPTVERDGLKTAVLPHLSQVIDAYGLCLRLESIHIETCESDDQDEFSIRFTLLVHVWRTTCDLTFIHLILFQRFIYLALLQSDKYYFQRLSSSHPLVLRGMSSRATGT
ncbi:hypothetical protein BCR43DRAFT_516591 [Syncephalastrum racemosum]|uniref:Uncharacterized protein n=1 Tax=Syncephalastrum racemosum TaxID=13706 RepID=A0A1X2HA75_SYNRA|nr:hypothetical protein BCR43DRAFT_516591 [Syncephalastrum racemosum]